MNTIEQNIVALLQGDLVDPTEVRSLLANLVASQSEQQILLEQIRLDRDFAAAGRNVRMPSTVAERILAASPTVGSIGPAWRFGLGGVLLGLLGSLSLLVVGYWLGTTIGVGNEITPLVATSSSVDPPARSITTGEGRAEKQGPIPTPSLQNFLGFAPGAIAADATPVRSVVTPSRSDAANRSPDRSTLQGRRDRPVRPIPRHSTTRSTQAPSSIVPPTRISGIVNAYAAITALPDRSTILLDENPRLSFAPGDLVMIVQMQGVDGAIGNPEAVGAAGLFEYGRVASLDDRRVTLAAAMRNDFTLDAGMQLVRVPEYENVRVDNDLTALPWDGRIGGVVAIVASGRLELAADIDLTGRGFRGGIVEHQSTVVPEYVTDLFGPVDPERYGRKGEGILGFGIGDRIAGRAPLANGGGGGGNHNAGGGGGAGGGCGGAGGYSYRNRRYKSGDYRQTGGFGGLAIDVVPLRLVAGGGGGAGHSNISPLIGVAKGTGGARGGGVVIVAADEIVAAGGTIVVDGADAEGAGADGAGGGGGAGFVLLQGEEMSGRLAISAVGGRGGNTYDTLERAEIGTGGGGGGGTIIIDKRLASADLLLAVEGGAAGLTTDGNLYGAEPGCVGAIRYRPLVGSASITPLIPAFLPSGAPQRRR